MSFNCDKCQKVFNSKRNYKYHINRDRPCIKDSCDTICTRCGDKFYNKSSLVRHKKICTLPNISGLSDDDILEIDDGYATGEMSDTLDSCNNKSEAPSEQTEQLINIITNLNSQLKELAGEVIKLKSETGTRKHRLRGKQAIEQLTETTHGNNSSIIACNSNNNNNNNLTNSNNTNKINIKINNYNQPNDFLTKADYIEIMGHGYMAILELLKKLHFNAAHPENHNMYISNLQANYIHRFEESWGVADKPEVIDDVYDALSMQLEDQYTNTVNELDGPTKAKIGRFINDMDNSEIVNRIKKQMTFLMYNNKTLIEKTKRTYQEELIRAGIFI